MAEKALRKLFLGLLHVHILHLAENRKMYGGELSDELNRLESISPGTLYPLLHQMESDGLLTREEQKVDGRIRKYYISTSKGAAVLAKAREYISDLDRILNKPKDSNSNFE